MILASNPLTPLEDVLRTVLDWLHGSIGLPWAWSVVALVVLVRILIVPLTVRQIHSMQNLQRHAPEMKEIQRKYKQDKKKQQEELMKFYRENNINPAASCLPLLAQLPVFLALYFVLNTFSKEAARAGSPIFGDNFEWLGLVKITEKASAGWGPLLLVIYVVSQTLSTLLMSTTMDKTQRMILLIMPVAFVFIVVNFKVGLVLYWVTSNLWTVGQGLITRRLVPKPPPPPKRSSRTPPKRAPEPAPATAAGAAADTKGPAPSRPAAPRKVKRKKRKARR
jgi:YidC/Oxa1 family membrane protein insertase